MRVSADRFRVARKNEAARAADAARDPGTMPCFYLNPTRALTVVRRAESQIYLEAAKSKREREWPRIARAI
jgi:hypothetical protein